MRTHRVDTFHRDYSKDIRRHINFARVYITKLTDCIAAMKYKNPVSMDYCLRYIDSRSHYIRLVEFHINQARYYRYLWRKYNLGQGLSGRPGLEVNMESENITKLPEFDVGEISGRKYAPSLLISVYATCQLGNMVMEVQHAGEVPNAFHRHMQRCLLGIKWELKNPGLHNTWWWKIKKWLRK